ncbi:MAG: glycosyltransferase [bacterium]|nr:glycosyltransferase [bacterium]
MDGVLMHILFDLRTIERLPVAHQIDLMSMWDRVLPTLEAGMQITVFITSDAKLPRLEHPALRYVSSGKNHHRKASREELFAVIKRHQPTHYLSPDPRLPPPREIPSFFLLSEMSHLFADVKKGLFKRWRRFRVIHHHLSIVTGVICPSRALFVRLVATFGWSFRHKGHVVHHGIHPAFRTHTVNEITLERRAFLIPRSYAILLGNNLETLKTPLYALGRSEDVSAITCVIVGPSHLNNDLRETIREAHLEGLVRFIDDDLLTMQQLSTLYSGAVVTFEPSLNADYRPSILQSMASGTPVICAASDDNDELYGNSMLVVHPTDITEWLKAFEMITLSSLLRERLTTRGFECVAEKGWGKTWRAIYDVLRQA